MSRFLQALLSGQVLLMDGAMGTELERAGISEDECYELWNLTHPDRVRAIHQAYVSAGAQVLLTNTFQANPAALSKYRLEYRLEEMSQAAIDLAQTSGSVSFFVLGDIGPIGPNDLSKAGLLAQSLRGADALLLETYSDREVLLRVLEACHRALPSDPLPILVSLAYRRIPGRGLRTASDDLPEECALRLGGVAALGVNCGRDIGMDEAIEIVRRYRQHTDLPLFARPNAGTPTGAGPRRVYPNTPEKMAARLPELLEAGVSMVGGCCGTTPEHIAAFRPIIEEWNRCRRF